MVKNTTGGSKTKGQARKLLASNSNVSSILRLPSQDLEKFAFVTKMLGNGMCYVSIDQIENPVICHIRNKFKGRSKNNNIVSVNTVILVGMREWESSPKNCDLLEVYSGNDVKNILELPTVPNNIKILFRDNSFLGDAVSFEDVPTSALEFTEAQDLPFAEDELTNFDDI
jgi:translation initiation factor IF-1